ncbi:Cytochrome c-554 [Sulfitobacter noctilucae]|uniref:c-type cytochrome n=1 Tax=Sulfitobacter noctilucae TaxID=1342302 RepID=UPI00046AA0C4|nr:cytochrome c [Sulfitobacter noctilucae]KIN60959.1 Cytochrome c-554 [Sulfitobacter noctilucae]
MRSSTLKPILTGILAATIGTALFAESHAKLDPAVAARHHQMQMIGYHTGILGAIAKGEMDYDAAMVSAAAQNLASLATMERATLWIEGTEQGTTAGSRAKAEIWSDPNGFAQSFQALADAATALTDASDAAAVGAGMGDLGGACKACHEKYRGPKN